MRLFNEDHTARTCELGITIGDEAYWGRGYGRESVQLLLEYAFRYHNFHKVWLHVHAANARAIRSYAGVRLRCRRAGSARMSGATATTMTCWSWACCAKSGEQRGESHELLWTRCSIELHALADPEQLEGMSRYGMSVDERLGIKIPQLRRLAKQLGRDHELALALWETGIAEARILASMVDEPARVTAAQMDDWVQDFDSWDVCDQVCMNLFDKTPLAWQKVRRMVRA